MDARNLFELTQSTGLGAEEFETLASLGGMRIERIVSRGQSSPPGFWYDQAHAEWIVVLQGAAHLRIEGEDVKILRPGDSLMLAAHVRHRVEWTDPDSPTIWLAVHFEV